MAPFKDMSPDCNDQPTTMTPPTMEVPPADATLPIETIPGFENMVAVLDIGGEKTVTTNLSRLRELCSFVKVVCPDSVIRDILMQGERMVPIWVDTSPDSFAPVLDYVRTEAFPLFWIPGAGFELGKYAKLAQVAKQFGVVGLHFWIVNEGYKSLIAREFNCYTTTTEFFARHRSKEEVLISLRGDGGSRMQVHHVRPQKGQNKDGNKWEIVASREREWIVWG